ncbi:MAG: hypothetical protein Kow0069_17240 [Promethearchaeota archaeon]
MTSASAAVDEPVPVGEVPTTSPVRTMRRYVAFYPFLFVASVLPSALWAGQFVFSRNFFDPASFAWPLFILPIMLVVWWVTWVFCTIAVGKVVLLVVNAIHRPREGVFDCDPADRDFRFWNLRGTIARFVMWVTHTFPLPWLDIIALKVLGVKATGGSAFFDTYVDPEFIEVGDNSLFGLGAFVFSSMIAGNKLIVKRTKVGTRTLIGANAAVSPGTTIGDDVLYGSLCTTRIGQCLDDEWVYAGQPCRQLKPNKMAKVLEYRGRDVAKEISAEHDKVYYLQEGSAEGAAAVAADSAGGRGAGGTGPAGAGAGGVAGGDAGRGEWDKERKRLEREAKRAEKVDEKVAKVREKALAKVKKAEERAAAATVEGKPEKKVEKAERRVAELKVKAERKEAKAKRKQELQFHWYVGSFLFVTYFSYLVPFLLFYAHALLVAKPLFLDPVGRLGFIGAVASSPARMLLVLLTIPPFLIGLYVTYYALSVLLGGLLMRWADRACPPERGVFQRDFRVNARMLKFYHYRGFLARFVDWKVSKCLFPWLVNWALNKLGVAKIGRRVTLDDSFHGHEFLEIGDDVYVGPGIIVATHTVEGVFGRLVLTGTRIEAGCTVASGSLVGPDAHLEENSHVLAGGLAKGFHLRKGGFYRGLPVFKLPKSKVRKMFKAVESKLESGTA